MLGYSKEKIYLLVSAYGIWRNNIVNKSIPYQQRNILTAKMSLKLTVDNLKRKAISDSKIIVTKFICSILTPMKFLIMTDICTSSCKNIYILNAY